MRWLRFALVLLAAGAVVMLLMIQRLRGSGVTAVARGEEVARRSGCFACHGAGGAGGIPDPGGENAIPGFNAESASRFIQGDAELEQWVLDGRPARLRDSPPAGDPLIAMPAYRSRLPPAQWRDLRAWLRAAHALDAPPAGEKAARAGWEAARDSGCFGCHGPSGHGLRRNPGSFAGYIPGWDSGASRDLARDDAEVEEWIRNGKTSRVEKNAAARFFMKRQLIQTPPYDPTLSDEQVAAIVAYIRWMRAPVKTG